MPIRRAVSRWILIPLLAFVTQVQAGNRTLAPGHVPAVIRTLRPTGRVAGDTSLKLTISLPLLNSNQLQNFLGDVYNPASPNYRHFLSASQFAAQFSPTADQYRAVEAFARSNHLTVLHTHPNRLLLDIRADAASIEKAFAVRLQTYRRTDGSGEFFAPDIEPSVDGEVAILDVTGLSNYRLPRPLIHERKSDRPADSAHPNIGSASGGAYFGNDFRAAYAPGVALTGAGQSIGLLEFDGYYTADITNYEARAGLAPVPLQTILLDNFSGTPTSVGNAEVSLDIEMAVAMAPGAAKVLVYEGGPSGSPNDVLNRMATDNSAKALACSWTWSGGPGAATDQILQEMAAQGQSFFCASGDSDAYAPGTLDDSALANAPSDSPYVTSVGATTLTTTGPGGARVSETVWNWGNSVGSSGGVSSYYAIPSWQAGVSMAANGGSSAMRNIPDVAMAGDNIYVAYGNGSSGVFGGTSCAAPLWAAFVALANQQAASFGSPTLGFLNPALYTIGKSINNPGAFNDITNGNNTSPSSTNNFFATTGYDLCSGWGTPNGAALINLLAAPADPLGISPTNELISAGSPGGPFSVNTWNFTLTDTGAGPLAWAVGNSTPWLNVVNVSGSLASGNAGATVTATLNAAATNLSAGSYSALISFTNLTTGNVATRLITLNVLSQLVQNGGFESGSMAGWTASGSTTYTLATTSAAYVHSGSEGVEFGPYEAMGYLSQTIPTVPGKSYVVSLWLCNPKPGGTPNQFNIQWDGTKIFGVTNLPITGWTNLQFIVNASTSATPLQLSARNDPGYFGLDDVSVLPFATPSLQSLAKVENTVQLSLTTTPGLIYQLQYITNLAQPNWSNLGQPFTATASVTTFSDPAATDLQRYYRVLVHP